ncbi:helix-turn-helix transcriptional regulator [Streptomyces sp. NPDC004539]|uniref:helix-turn-helix domain-containing protein n=1 Tax=Streptomyces sp. NPDC004539 TaxID=3154280 RepID=UPI0033A96A64
MAKKKGRSNGSAHRMVGAVLAVLRRNSGRTQRELARDFKISEGLLASIEQGRRPLHPITAAELDDFLETGGVLVAMVGHLPEADLIARWYEEFLEQERTASYHLSYEIWLIPGLLQTRAYAESLFRSRVPAFPEEEIAERLATRMRRKEILAREAPPTMCFVIWEAAVRAPFGGTAVWLEQLRHLRACCELPDITVQILPMDRSSHAGCQGPIHIMETPEPDRFVYAEGAMGTVLITAPDDIMSRCQKFDMLRSQALNPDESMALLDQIIKEER